MHLVVDRMHLLDGSAIEGEAHLLGVLDDDRIATPHETGRPLAPSDGPRAPTAVRAGR